MKNRVFGLFLACCLCVAIVPFGGCGSGVSGALIASTDHGDPRMENHTLISKGTGPNGEDEIHYLGVWTSFDALRDYAYVSFNGSTFVVEEMSGSFNTFPLQPGDYLYENGIARASVNIWIEGTFVPGNGAVTPGMAQLNGLPIGLDGSSGIDSFELLEDPDCENCWSTESVLSYYWSCSSEYDPEEIEEKDYSFGNCRLHIDGGTILRPSIRVAEIVDDNPLDNQEPWNQWYLSISFDLIVTGETDDLQVAVPCEGDDCGKG